MPDRYEIREAPPITDPRIRDLLGDRADEPMFRVWDTELDKQVPFGQYSDRERAQARIDREKARES